MSPLVQAAWLAERLGDDGVRVVDVRWSLLEAGKGRRAYEAGHVPGAVFLDVDGDLAAPPGQGPGRHPLPAPAAFAATMSRAGVDEGVHVVAYDFGDGSTAARLWWLLRHHGHDRVSVLDGGFARWTAEGRPVESGVSPPAPRTFTSRLRPEMRIDAAGVERLRHEAGTLLIDARAPERYRGDVEPIDPVAGHVPGAVNRPYPANVRAADDPRLRDPAELRAAFAALGAERATDIVSSCGSGINACQNLLALEVAGLTGARLYEGSWSDWCSDPARAIRTGEHP